LKQKEPQDLREIGATVLRNENSVLEALGSDQRIYRYQYHKQHVCGAFRPGDVIRIYYTEPDHNDPKVSTVEEWESPSFLAPEGP
jgi:hypothetical protein